MTLGDAILLLWCWMFVNVFFADAALFVRRHHHPTVPSYSSSSPRMCITKKKVSAFSTSSRWIDPMTTILFFGTSSSEDGGVGDDNEKQVPSLVGGKNRDDELKIVDPNLKLTISQIQRVNVSVPESVTPDEYVEISYLHWPAETSTEAAAPPAARTTSSCNNSNNHTTTIINKKLPILLLPGFDCSCFEFYRLGPLLAKMGHDTYAVDILGWGQTQISNNTSFTGESKIQALCGFWKTVIVDKHPNVCLLGVSLGAVPAIELISRLMGSHDNSIDVNDKSSNGHHHIKKNPVKAMILVSSILCDASFMKYLPTPWVRFCVFLLGIRSLRKTVESISCWDRSNIEDSIQIWNWNRQRDGWEYAQASFIKSGGFILSQQQQQQNIETIPPTLLVWGRNDILQHIINLGGGSKYIFKGISAKQRYDVTNCGHFPHLEKPEETAMAIEEFLMSIEST